MSALLGPGAPDENDESTQATPASADPLQLSGPELEPEEMAALAAVRDKFELGRLTATLAVGVPTAVISVRISSLASTLSMRAFSVLMSFPRRGRIAW